METIWLTYAHFKELPGFNEVEKQLSKVAGQKGYRLEYLELGVGAYESLWNLQAVLRGAKEIAGILHVGSAGSSQKGDMGKITLAHRFAYPSLSAEEIPGTVEKEWSCKPFLPANKPGLDLDVLVAPSWGVSIEENRYRAAKSTPPIWENMEASGLAFFCVKAGIAFQTLLYCTNFIGPNGRKEWAQNYARGGELLLKELVELFQALPPSF